MEGSGHSRDGDFKSGALSSNKLQETQSKVDEVVSIMKVNVDKVLERDQKLSELDDRADALQHGAAQFESTSGKLKKKLWWRNMKMMIILGILGLIILIAIIATLMPSSEEKEKKP